MVVLDDVFAIPPVVALHETVLYFAKEEAQENHSLAKSLLDIASQYYDLSSYVGYEMWCHTRNFKKSVYHIDKDQVAYEKYGELRTPICSIIYYLDVKNLEGGRLMFPSKTVPITPKTNRLVIFDKKVAHKVEQWTGSRVSIMVNPWAEQVKEPSVQVAYSSY
jgi:hypothetical protein